MTVLHDWAHTEWQRFALGARRAGACAAFAGACVGAWVLGLWVFGSRFVYDVGPAIEPAKATRVSSYPLDGLSRAATRGVCPDVALTTFAGEAIPFVPAARVAAPFRARLIELEHVVGELSREVYGRAPSAILVAASYDCRPVSGNRRRLSEHAFGNAIDITGFRFSADGASSAAGFEVSISSHWKAIGGKESERHARFLHGVAEALLARDIFRTLLGPSHRDHADHFHFDMAPHRYVDL